MLLDTTRRMLRKYGSKEKAKILASFFKTGPGEYGEGDCFLGVKVPDIRKVAKESLDLPNKDLLDLLRSKIHEERLLALLILVENFKRGTEKERRAIFDLYMKNLKWVNNWDLVDLSAPNIIGAFLTDKDRRVLSVLARSKNLWARRVSIVSTHHFIRKNDFTSTLELAEMLLNDTEDLLHKAVGWMLREVGKRDIEAEKRFLTKYGHTMPRTMLRYAIERFPQKEREFLLSI